MRKKLKRGDRVAVYCNQERYTGKVLATDSDGLIKVKNSYGYVEWYHKKQCYLLTPKRKASKCCCGYTDCKWRK